MKFLAGTSPMKFGALLRYGRKALAVGLLMAANPALAQLSNCVANGPFLHCNGPDGSYTTCNAVGPTLNCQTMGGAQRPSASQPADQGGGMIGFIRSIGERKARARATEALQAGDCPKAEVEALKSGDPDFARNVQTYCARVAMGDR